jgi:hypothetical protein
LQKILPRDNRALQDIADLLVESHRVFVIAGAGISTSCSIPDSQHQRRRGEGEDGAKERAGRRRTGAKERTCTASIKLLQRSTDTRLVATKGRLHLDTLLMQVVLDKRGPCVDALLPM